MKKICLIDYDMSVTGGVEQVTASLANALADFYEVHLVSLSLENTLAYNIDDRVIFKSFLTAPKRLREMQRKLCKEIRLYFREHDISVAFLQGNYVGFILAPIRFLSETKLVFCNHGALMNQWHQKDMVFIQLFASLLCHHVVTLTEKDCADYRKRFFLPGKKVSQIYNWLEDDVACSSEYKKDAKQIISAGRFGKEKGFDQLIKAFAPVAKRHPDWSLTIFGDGEMMETVDSLVKEFSIENQVNLPGMCTDLKGQYKNFSIYVLPSYREGFGLVLLDAKANRLPIISFDVVAGPREIIQDKVDGLLVPPEDIPALSNAMNFLIEHPEIRQAMSDRSQDNLEKFSKEKILLQWRSLIEDLTSKR